MANPLERLRYHVTGAIERGEKEAIENQGATNMTTTQNMRLQLLIEAAENAVDNFAMPKGTNYYWDELRASILLAKRDRIDNQDTCSDCGVGAGEHADDCPRL